MHAWITCIGAYLSQEVVPGNNHRLVKGGVDRRRGEADHSLSLEAAATGPGDSENQRRMVVTLLVIVLNSATPIASIVNYFSCVNFASYLDPFITANQVHLSRYLLEDNPYFKTPRYYHERRNLCIKTTERVHFKDLGTPKKRAVREDETTYILVRLPRHCSLVFSKWLLQ